MVRSSLPHTVHPQSLTQPLKNDGWKTILSFWVSVTFQGANCFHLEVGSIAPHTRSTPAAGASIDRCTEGILGIDGPTHPESILYKERYEHFASQAGAVLRWIDDFSPRGKLPENRVPKKDKMHKYRKISDFHF